MSKSISKVINIAERKTKKRKQLDVAELERIMLADRPKGAIDCYSLAEFRKEFLAHGKQYRYILALSSLEEYQEALAKYNNRPYVRFSFGIK